MTRGFLLERARVVVVPVGLQAVTRAVVGQELCASHSALEFAKQIVGRLANTLRQDGRACQLDVSLGSAFHRQLPATEETRHRDRVGHREVIPYIPGLTAWDSTAPPKSQLKTAGAFHSLAETGTAAMVFPQGDSVTAEMLAELLRYAWEHTAVARLQFARTAATQRQMT